MMLKINKAIKFKSSSKQIFLKNNIIIIDWDKRHLLRKNQKKVKETVLKLSKINKIFLR